MGERVEITLTLEGDVAKRFLELKKKLGVESDTDLLGLLVTRAHEELRIHYTPRQRDLIVRGTRPGRHQTV